MSTTRQFAHTISSKYEETKDLDIKAIAKLIRRDIQTAQANGDLPKDLRTSVRSATRPTFLSISVNATLPGPDRVPSTDPRSSWYRTDAVYVLRTATAEQVAVSNRLYEIVNAYYWDDSNPTTGRFTRVIQVSGTDR